MPALHLSLPAGLAVREWDDDGVVYDARHARTHLLDAASALVMVVLRDAAGAMTREDVITAVVGDAGSADGAARHAAAQAVQELLDLGLIDAVSA